MKRFFIIWLSFLCVLCCQAQQKHALIVAIANYPKESGWSNIHSNNDLQILLPQFERLDFHINTLTDRQATKRNIIQSLQYLIKQLKAGDDVCLHFSCHGQQMEDDNGDEVDGLDEALIPYDAQSTYQKGVYEGENHLRDDELEKFLISIRQKTGTSGSVLITFDACHSGTANRIEEYVEDNDAPIRGTNVIFSSNPFYIAPDNKHIERKTRLAQQNGLSPICIISACQSFQRNFEIKVGNSYYGTLSYSLYKVLKEVNQWNRTYYSKIWEQAKSFSSKQIPMIESSYAL